MASAGGGDSLPGGASGPVPPWAGRFSAADLAERLLAHYDRHGRALPWRGERELYRLWVSEVMLQQTTVSAVIPYYQRFLERFPTPAALAAAPLEAVLGEWQGLGYYGRARNLHAAARQVVERHGGRLPEGPEALEGLPGIGRSTAHAILAIGREQPLPILDGNVKRVLARLLALEEPVERPAARARLWATAALLTPARRPGDYAQAIMDLGATLCTRSRPRCGECPWVGACGAHARGTPTAFPVRPEKPVKPERWQGVVVVEGGGGRLLFFQRPAQGLLGGLWEPPATPVADAPAAAPWAEELAIGLGLGWGEGRRVGELTHTFTHFRLTVTVWHLRSPGGGAPPPGERPWRWVDPPRLAQLPMATLHRKVLALVKRGE